MKLITDTGGATSYGGRFSGTVDLQMLHKAGSGERADVARVHFHAGAVTNWHQHPGGQLLLVLDGLGRVGNADEQWFDLAPGAFVDTPANDRHWHGAMPGSDCVWLAITYGETAWEEVNPDIA